MQAVGLLVGVLLIIVFPALCIGRIADQLGRSSVRFALLSILPCGVLIALGLLALKPTSNQVSHEEALE